MAAIRLLVLGAVRRHERTHGYQVRNDLEYWSAHEWSDGRPGSIHHALKQTAKQGLLHAHRSRPAPVRRDPRRRRPALRVIPGPGALLPGPRCILETPVEPGAVTPR